MQEIKEKLATLPRTEQDQVIAYVFHLRHADDVSYQAELSRRMKDKDPSHWLTPDEFERELDQRSGQ